MLTFADRLNLLFRAFLRPPDERGERKEWSNLQVARAAETVHDRSVITREHLRMLRNGERPRPSVETAAAIARAFEFLSQSEPEPGRASAIVAYLAIDPTEASPDEVAQVESIHQQLARAVDMRENKLLGLMARLGDLEDPESLDEIRELVTRLEDKERSRRGGFLRRHRR